MALRQGNVTVDFEQVGVAEALKWLEANTQNRPVKDEVVAGYARDMREGKWRETTTPLKFDTQGVLVDGQHRLWAVVESQAVVKFLVARGVDPAERLVQDIGVKRSVRDILCIDGRAASNTLVAIVNQMVQGFEPRQQPTTQEQLAYFEAHHEAAQWALGGLASNQRGLKQAPVLAPVARAWYTCDKGKLARFLEVLRTGMMENVGESGAILLRDAQLRALTAKVRVGKIETYGKSERAIMAVLLEEPLKVLKAVSEEQFEIPQVRAARVRKAKAVKGVKK